MLSRKINNMYSNKYRVNVLCCLLVPLLLLVASETLSLHCNWQRRWNPTMMAVFENTSNLLVGPHHQQQQRPYSQSAPPEHNANENPITIPLALTHTKEYRLYPCTCLSISLSLFSLHFRRMARATYRAITVRKQTYKTESGLGVAGGKNQYPRGC